VTAVFGSRCAMRLTPQSQQFHHAENVPMRSMLLILVATVGLVAFEGLDGRAVAQQPPASSASSEPAGAAARKPEVIVQAQRAELEQRISTFVAQATDFRYGEGLARWQVPVCPLVTGIRREWGEYILKRVSEIGQAAGVPLAGEKCRPNLYVLVSKQPQADLQDLAKRHREVVFAGASPVLIDRFIATSRPVRTWYDTAQRTAEGLPMHSASFPGISDQVGDKAIGVIVMDPVVPSQPLELTTNAWAQASHLTLNVCWAIYQVFVVVDPTQFKGVSLGQLADYVAMAGLAQLKVDARLGDAPSILTLFDRSPQEASAGITDWDRAFLKSMYSTDQKSVVQKSQIAIDMMRTIAPE
jgi:hypothetical protein